MGLIHSGPEASEGYTLFSGLFNNGVFLVDNCGRVVNQWDCEHRSGVADYLAMDGNLLRAARDLNWPGNGITIGGTGQRLQKLDWEGNMIWDWVYADTYHILHHDIVEMPNGNILALAYERIDSADAIAWGRDSALVATPFIAPDVVLEVRPIGTDSAEIVWEWHVWDHVIQDHDSTMPHYGSVVDHPELFDLNWYSPNLGFDNMDWTHYNGIDYNEELDQIAISSQLWCEFIIIDHSTTTQEAAGHTGGRYGKGGDCLYRWGNPHGWKMGTPEDRKLWGPHGIMWIPEGYPNEGKMMIYNNGNWRQPSYSEVFILDPPQSAPGVYEMSNGVWGPEEPEWTFGGPDRLDFYSFFISNARPQPNGNVLICEGDEGKLFEVTPDGREVWRYVNPQTPAGIISQYDTLPWVNIAYGNSTFRTQRYAPDFPGFAGRDLTPGDPLELNPVISDCETGPPAIGEEFIVYPVPTEDILHIYSPVSQENPMDILIFNSMGQKVGEWTFTGTGAEMDVSDLLPGHYYVRIGEDKVYKILKLFGGAFSN